MGGELGGPGAKPPGLGHSVQGGSGGGAPGLQVYGVQEGPEACPRFGRLG